MNASNGMTKDEFITKAKQLGYSDSTITNIIKFHDQAKEKGINIPLHIDLIKLPLKVNFQEFNIK